MVYYVNIFFVGNSWIYGISITCVYSRTSESHRRFLAVFGAKRDDMQQDNQTESPLQRLHPLPSKLCKTVPTYLQKLHQLSLLLDFINAQYTSSCQLAIPACVCGILQVLYVGSNQRDRFKYSYIKAGGDRTDTILCQLAVSITESGVLNDTKGRTSVGIIKTD